MESAEFTTLLKSWQQGNKQALDDLTPVVYRELHRIAVARMREERGGHTLSPTALIHEAYMQLVEHKQDQWHGRGHFFSVASHLMRQILAKHARARGAQKRGGAGQVKVELDEAAMAGPERDGLFVALDDALDELQKFDERKARIMELKYFGGLTIEEIAEVLAVSVSTITRESRLAEAWLQDSLTRS